MIRLTGFRSISNGSLDFHEIVQQTSHSHSDIVHKFLTAVCLRKAIQQKILNKLRKSLFSVVKLFKVNSALLLRMFRQADQMFKRNSKLCIKFYRRRSCSILVKLWNQFSKFYEKGLFRKTKQYNFVNLSLNKQVLVNNKLT